MAYKKFLSTKQKQENAQVAQLEADLNFVTGAWVSKWGISNWDLTNHPQIDDVIILIKIRQTQWHKFDSAERGYWSYVWDWCYKKQFALKNKHLDKISNIIHNSEYRHNKVKAKLQASKTTQHPAPWL